jgi:hypothetical protein
LARRAGGFGSKQAEEVNAGGVTVLVSVSERGERGRMEKRSVWLHPTAKREKNARVMVSVSVIEVVNESKKVSVAVAAVSVVVSETVDVPTL